MRRLLSIEEAAQFVFGIYMLYRINGPVAAGWLVPLFFVPDLFALGFLINNRTGAYAYNFSHHKAIPMLCLFSGLITDHTLLIQLGILWFSHITFDRTIGYGLKYPDNPNLTHLGFIGKEKFKNKLNTYAKGQY